MNGAPKVVMSGMRPTGRLHLGNYWGALKNWVALQDAHRCFFEVADWHMLTTGFDDTTKLRENGREMVLDWLAAGLDPAKCVIFRQSDVLEHAEFTLLLSMVTPLSWLENNPTWKEQLQELAKGDERLRTHGFLGYPVMQAADILLYRGELVPVGKDQLPHLELSREIARRFNFLYGAPGRPLLPEPQPLLTPTPKVPGADGRKMSKSYGNAVDLLETAASLKTKVMGMYTDPSRLKATDPGHPLPCPENEPGCVVFALHQLYGDFAASRETECREGKIGCVACKKDLLESIEPPFDKFRAAREAFAKDDSIVDSILADGAKKAGEVAGETMRQVRRAMGLR